MRDRRHWPGPSSLLPEGPGLASSASDRAQGQDGDAVARSSAAGRAWCAGTHSLVVAGR